MLARKGEAKTHFLLMDTPVAGTMYARTYVPLDDPTVSKQDRYQPTKLSGAPTILAIPTTQSVTESLVGRTTVAWDQAEAGIRLLAVVVTLNNVTDQKLTVSQVNYFIRSEK